MSTIRDVAKLANVSTATVSRILNQDPRHKITPETRARVMDAVKALNYKPNPRVPQRKVDSTSDPAQVKIGCILSVTKKKYNDPYFMAILSGAEERLQELGYNISFIRAGGELTDRNRLEALFAEEITGLILMESLNSDIYQYIRSRVAHIVGIDTRRDDIDNVGYDHHRVAALATQHLISLGHTKIGYIGGSGESRQIMHSHRYQGYFFAMYEAGLSVDPDLVIDCEWDEETCIGKINDLCRRGALPTAFFAASDLMAIAAMKALSDNGIRVPEDVAIIGMSNIEMSRFTTPSLSTVQVPKEEIGIVAANLLVERLRGSKLLPQKITLPTTLILRDST